MLGTNDLKDRFSLTAFDIAAGAGVVGDLARRSGAGINGGAPEVLLIAPPLVKQVPDTAWVSPDVEAKSGELSRHYQRFAKRYRCHWVDASPIVTASALDGVHLEGEGHRKFGLAMAQQVREILKSS
jgi:lysophospholipase L1-like esterase